MDELRGIMERNNAIRVLRVEGRPERGRDSLAEIPPRHRRGMNVPKVPRRLCRAGLSPAAC
jgi:hypothetical protein